MFDLDPRLTFDAFVVGSSNRLAAAAARRVADAPGAAYNPLFVYAASGLGKTHLLMSIGNELRRAGLPQSVVYAPIEPLAEELRQSEGGDEFRARLHAARILLLDDVQGLSGRRDLQEDILAVWDAVAAKGGQLVIASDRPPTEIAGLDRRLVTRFAGGLVADISPPASEERVAIVTRRAQEGGHRLAPGVPEVIAQVAFGNVREVHGALNRIIAVQEVEQRLMNAAEVPALVGAGRDTSAGQEFSSFVHDIEGAVDELVVRHSPEQRLAEAILRYEGEGYRTARLEAALGSSPTPQRADQLIRAFAADVARLEQAGAAIRALEASAPELARVDLLLDPDRVADAEQLIERVRERTPGAVAPARNGKPPSPPTERIPAGSVQESTGDVRDPWFLSREKVLWSWPYVEDWIVPEVD